MSRQDKKTSDSAEESHQRQTRWRLMMGSGSEELCGDLSQECQAQEACLEFLYDREMEGDRNVRGGGGQGGGLGGSQLTVPDWINQIHELFPKQTIERLEKDALERYQINEIVTNVDVLSRAKPSTTLMKAVLRTKHLMNQDILTAAQALVRKVVDKMMQELAEDVQSAFRGAVNRRRRSFLKIAKNFDLETTLRRNLKNYDSDLQRVILETPYFFSRSQRQVDRWQIIILVDESGSMLDSVIHSAVTAAIFYGMKMMKVHLCIFDTSVVDLTDQIVDPVETLMKVQLGGGTDIGQAVAYAAEIVENPDRTIVALITDFYEGAPEHRLFSAAKHLIDSGVTCLGLAALDGNANP
ncbi:VWA domain-containing protein, partial [Mariniblastus sp.]|nr:VWA domain-containing protein [Mariniblastus sp.]